MAIAYSGQNNTPMAIIRGVSGEAADGTNRDLRVGAVGCPLPAGWTDGTPVNPVFFEALKKASMILIGVDTEAELSAAIIPLAFFSFQKGQPTLEALLQASFPNGQLLAEPFFCQINRLAGNTPEPQFTIVTFQDTGGASAPLYADFRVIVSGATDINTFIVQRFHTIVM